MTAAAPFYGDGQVVIYCGDVRRVDLAAESVAAVVTSPPYNVGVAYERSDDALPWARYWELAEEAAAIVAKALVRGGRVWVNTAVSVPSATYG